MSTRLLWVAVLGLSLIVCYQGSTAYTPPAKPKGFLTAPAGTWTAPDGTRAAVVMLFYEDGTTGWVSQPIEEKPVLQLGK